MSLLTRSAKIFAASSYLPSPKAGAEMVADLLHLLGEISRDQLLGDLAAVVEHALGRADPLPDLRARDLGGGGVLHQVEDRHAALPAQPGADVLDPDADVVAQARLGDRLLGLELEQVRGDDVTSSRCLRSGSAAGIGGRRPPCATGTRAGCATQVPSWPSVASRSLSARTLASAASLASGSFLIGICAAMPPIAWTPRRWQVLISSSA